MHISSGAQVKGHLMYESALVHQKVNFWRKKSVMKGGLNIFRNGFNSKILQQTFEARSMDELITPERLYSRQEILSKPSPIPEISGVYGWFFKDVPPFVLTEGCIRHQNMTLL